MTTTMEGLATEVSFSTDSEYADPFYYPEPITVDEVVGMYESHTCGNAEHVALAYKAAKYLVEKWAHVRPGLDSARDIADTVITACGCIKAGSGFYIRTNKRL